MTPKSPFRLGLVAVAMAVLAAPGLGCAAQEGVLELNWVFVDREGEAIYPGDQFAAKAFGSSCDLRGMTAAGEVRFDLQLELSVCDTACAANEPEGCLAAACQVVEPERFGCDTARASDPSMPSSDEPYQFTVRAVVAPKGGTACVNVDPACIAVPGPRQRHVEAGRLTDLQVYQIVVDIDASSGRNAQTATLDLEACGCA